MELMSKYQGVVVGLKRQAEQAEELHTKMVRLDRVLTTIGRFVDGRVVMMGAKAVVCVKVNKIADITPVIETIEAELGISFDKTHDAAEQGWRQFECAAAPWLRVDAELRADGPECRRVIVGYEQTPVYEIKCGDEVDTPDAIPPTQEK
jgi:hypothetical protein